MKKQSLREMKTIFSMSIKIEGSRNWVLLLSLILGNTCLIRSQELGNVPVATDFVEIHSNLNENEVKEFLNLSTELIQKYEYSSSFKDKSGDWDLAKYELFNALFFNDAYLTNYVLVRPKDILFYEYTTFVYDYMRPNNGINLRFKSAEIQSLLINASGQWVVQLAMDIEIFTTHNKSGSVTETIKPRLIRLQGAAIGERGSRSTPKFNRLVGSGTTLQKAEMSFIESSVGARFGQLSPLNSYGFQQLRPSVIFYGAHVDYLKNLGKSRSWFLWTGISIDYGNIISSFGNKYQSPSSQTGDLQGEIMARQISENMNFTNQRRQSLIFVSEVGGNSIEELRGIFRINATLGIRYQTMLIHNWDLFVAIGLSPGYLFSGNNGKRTIEYSGYQLPASIQDNSVIDPNFPGIDEIIKNTIGAGYLLSDEIVREERIAHSAQFSMMAIVQLGVRYKVGFNWGINGGLEYIGGLNNAFSFQGRDDLSLLASRGTEPTLSLVEDYAISSTISAIGVRIGVYFELGNKL